MRHLWLRSHESCAPGSRCCREEATFAGLLTHLREHGVMFTAHEMEKIRTRALDPVAVHHANHANEAVSERRADDG